MRKAMLLLVAGLFLALLLPFRTEAQLPFNPDWLDYNPSSGQFRLKNPPRLNPWPQSKETPSWGVHLWEFGDGHYSFEEAPVYRYRNAGTYTVRLHLTPFYATNGPVSFQSKVSAPGKAQKTPVYELVEVGPRNKAIRDKRALIETNTRGFIVPEQPVQIIAHYEAPTGYSGKRDGYLFVFYNKKHELNLGFKAFGLTGERTHYQEKAIGPEDIPATITGRLRGSGQVTALDFLNQYRDQLAYRVEGMGPGEQRRLFLTLESSRWLKLQRDKNRELSVGIVWVPDNNGFQKDKNAHEEKLQVLAVYDPNRIRVSPRIAYYRKGHPKTLHYRAEFQNNEEGIVRDVILNIPLDEGLSLSTVRIKETKPELPKCPIGYEGMDFSCISMDSVTSHRGDTLRLRLHNVGLEGKKSKGIFQNKQSTKGQVQFDIRTDNTRLGAQRVKAFIVFDSLDPVETRYAKTQWRRRSLMLRPGYSINPGAKGFENEASGFGQRFNLAIGFQNAPITTGSAWGGEAGYSTFHLSREVTEDIPESEQLFDGAQLLSRERAKITYLDLRGWWGYQYKGLIRAYGGAGLAMPASGIVEVETNINSPNGEYNILQSTDEARFGLFQSRDPLSIFDEESELRNSVGLSWQFGLEVGLLDYFSLGLSRDTRFFPTFYHKECAAINSWEVYLRFNLLPIGGKF